MYSRFERQQDKRSYVEKHVVFTGPTYLYPPDRIAPTRGIVWEEESCIPLYTGSAPAQQEQAPPPQQEEVPAEGGEE